MPFDSFGFQVESNPVVLALMEAKAKIKDRRRWTTDTTGKTADGAYVRATNPAAVSWCAVGAVKVVRPGVANLSVYDAAMKCLRRAARKVGGAGALPQGVNDGQGHSATMRMFDVAIEMARATAQQDEMAL